MEQTILLKNQEVKYKIKKSMRAKRLHLVMNCDTDIVVTVPAFFDIQKIKDILKEKADWILKEIQYFKTVGNTLRMKGNNRDFLQYKKQALLLVREKIQEFNRVYNFSYSGVTIRNQKTRWGSCSSKGTLSFNYQIVFLPPELVDYLIVHELCHLKEFNHSKQFWNLVSLTIPQYKKRAKELRKRILA